MPTRLVALEEGSDIPLDRSMVVVGRHPQCDARLDSLRVSRHHCCMTLENGDVLVRDLGSTNGIRINGQRVEFGRLRDGDELSIAHIRYRLDIGNNVVAEMTMADPGSRLENHPGHLGLNGNAIGNSNGVGNSNGHASGNGHANGNGNGNAPLRALRPQVAPSSGIPGVNPGKEYEQPLAAAVRDILPAGMADKCRIQVIVQMDPEVEQAEVPAVCRPDSSP